jgi:hypothetical protein
LQIRLKYIEVRSCFEALAEAKTMVQSDFGFDARLKSYRIFSSTLCVLITGGLPVELFGFPRADVPRVLY